MDDPVEFERRERPVDRCPRCLDRIPFAAKLLRDSPADLEAWPRGRKERTDTSGECPGRFFLDHEHADAMQHPMSRHDRGIAPAVHRIGDRFAVGRDEATADRIGQHRSVRRDVGGAPLAQDEALGFEPRPIRSRQHDACLERWDHSFVISLVIPAKAGIHTPWPRGCPYIRHHLPAIVAGGYGSRLWPGRRAVYFLLGGGKTTMEALMSWMPSDDPTLGDPRTCDALELIIVPRTRDLGDGFAVRRALPHGKRQMVGPFIFFDHFGPVQYVSGKGMDVRPHPHIGLATVTYLFDGSIMHRDSEGNIQEITPGAMNLMTAGKGIAHSERTPDLQRREGQKMLGLQSW